MNPVSILRIAVLAFEESVRKRIFYILFFLSLILVPSAFLINTMNLGNQDRVIKDFAITALELYGLLLTVSLMMTAVPNDLERKTIYPILAKPIRRSEYLWGKFLGNYAVIFINLAVLGAELVFLFYRLYAVPFLTFWKVYSMIVGTIWLLFLECGIVGAIVMLLSIYLSYAINICLTGLLYFAGSMSVFYVKYLESDPQFKMQAVTLKVLKAVLPNFQYLQIKNAFVNEGWVLAPGYMQAASLYAVVYILIIMLIADILFSARDL